MGIFSRKPNIEKLVKKGKIEGLIKALKHDEQSIQKQAAAALAETGDINGLIEALKHNDASIQKLAAEALAETENTGGLIEALKHKSDPEQKQIAEALAETGKEKAVDFLISALRDSDYFVRICAIEGLGKVKDRRVIAPLMKALGDEKSKVRNQAAKKLAKFKLNQQKILEEIYSRGKKGYDNVETIVDGIRHMGDFFILCKKCGEPSEALTYHFYPEVIRVLDLPYPELARYCENCNIVVCGNCAKAGPKWSDGYNVGKSFFGACPECNGYMTWASAHDIEKTDTVIIGASWLEL